MKLYTYCRNSAGERVRIALGLKGIAHDYVSAPTLPREQWLKINPQGLLPALEVDGRVVAQSTAILEYLEETRPAPTLLPTEPVLRAQARAFGQLIASDLHPINVQRVRNFLKHSMGVDEPKIQAWYRHWMQTALTALETALATRDHDWPFCFSDSPGWADLHLVPQFANARRFHFDLAPYPLLRAVDERCRAIEAFVRARPDHQPEYPSKEKT